MKAPDFAYVRPTSLDEALAMMAASPDGAVPLAGGQSLLAGLNMRLSTPEMLVDIGALDELKDIKYEDGEVHVGALVRHCDLLNSPVIATRLPLMAEAVRHVGHVAIRNRGTLGGSLANADPAAELPACIVALGAMVIIGSLSGCREVPVDAFFKGLFETDLQPGELVLGVRLPAQRPDEHWGFAELSRRHGDFALAGLSAIVALDRNRIKEARLVYFGCVDRAKRVSAVERALAGRVLPLEGTASLQSALSASLRATDSPGCSAATKLHLAEVLTGRVLGALRPVEDQ